MKLVISSFRRFSSNSNLTNLLLRGMPKDTTEHIERNQKQRIRIRERSKHYSPGTVNLQVLGSGARGSSSSIYLFSEQARYLFNCGEGTQRLAHEHRTKLTRMEHVFLTRKAWNRFGGVPGLCLTLQEIGVPKLSLHGPPGIDNIFESTRKFVVLRNMRVDTPTCKEGGFYEDSVVRVNYVPLMKAGTKQATSRPATPEDDWADKPTKSDFKDDTDYFKKYEVKNNGSAMRGKTADQMEAEAHREDMVMAYICKLQERPGTLDFAKCVEHGVPPGPLLGRLKNGYDVQLPNGTTVLADDVRGAPSPGSVFVFIDIPDESYLPALMACEAFKPHQKTAKTEDDKALVVVHFSSEEMMENPSYKEWMNGFCDSTTKHWFVNERNEFTGFFASHRIQRQLNELDNNIYPMLKERHPFLHNELQSDLSEADPIKLDAEPVEDKFKEFPELGILSAFHIRPPKGFDRNLEPYSNPEKVLEETLAVPNLPELIASCQEEGKKLIVARTPAQRAQEYPKVILFGTGSCIPNKTRNVSANLVHISEDNCALLDCGEGTLGQLIRFYGRDGADEVLKKLRLIYISHLHADHHLGLINILNRRRKVTSEKLMLLAPITMTAWLAFYNYQIEEIFSTLDFHSCTDVLGWNIEDNKRNDIHTRLGLVNISTCFVKHCPYSFGVALVMKNLMKSERHPNETVKITYSGDTLPCDELVSLGTDSDILIHEATMEDDLERDARIKMHSTVSQAIDIGKRMNAKFVILTHFSQRYAKIPLMAKNEENVAVGFDNMEVTLNDLPMMHLMYEPLKGMFADQFDLMEQKSLKRKYMQERKIIVDQTNGNQHNKKIRFNSSDED